MQLSEVKTLIMSLFPKTLLDDGTVIVALDTSHELEAMHNLVILSENPAVLQAFLDCHSAFSADKMEPQDAGSSGYQIKIGNYASHLSIALPSELKNIATNETEKQKIIDKIKEASNTPIPQAAPKPKFSAFSVAHGESQSVRSEVKFDYPDASPEQLIESIKGFLPELWLGTIVNFDTPAEAEQCLIVYSKLKCFLEILKEQSLSIMQHDIFVSESKGDNVTHGLRFEPREIDAANDKLSKLTQKQKEELKEKIFQAAQEENKLNQRQKKIGLALTARELDTRDALRIIGLCEQYYSSVRNNETFKPSLLQSDKMKQFKEDAAKNNLSAVAHLKLISDYAAKEPKSRTAACYNLIKGNQILDYSNQNLVLLQKMYDQSKKNSRFVWTGFWSKKGEDFKLEDFQKADKGSRREGCYSSLPPRKV